MHEYVTGRFEKGKAAFRATYSLLAGNSRFSLEMKVLLYIIVIRPVRTYGAPLMSQLIMRHGIMRASWDM